VAGYNWSDFFTNSSCHPESGVDVMIFRIFSPKFFAKKVVFAQTTASFRKNFIIASIFEKNASFFRRKLAKMAENCDRPPTTWLAKLPPTL
jgi:hypothetical protein